MTLRWFLSRKFRQTKDLWSHVRKLRDAQSDVLSAQALQPLDAALQNTEAALHAGADDETLAKNTAELEKTANKWLKPYPNAEWRENIEVFLVAIVVAMAIRTFFLCPFKIPTSSMQPSLFGVTVDPLYDASFEMPNLLTRAYRFVVQGAIYHQSIAPQDGHVTGIGQPETFLRFFHKQSVMVHYNDGTDAAVTTWLAPNPSDDQNHSFDQRIGLTNEHLNFHKGDPIIRFVETTGDHLFVDRMTLNFRHPTRGEIIVFMTKGIDDPRMDQTQFYIKRLVGLPGETVSIGEDRHVRINGRRLDSSTPRFANVYDFDPKIEARPVEHLSDQFYNGHILMPGTRLGAPSDSMTVPTNAYLVLGDNTKTSFDARFWGYVPRENIIGRSFFIYWPIASLVPPPNQSRFGWGQR